jgi:hypothetical protein
LVAAKDRQGKAQVVAVGIVEGEDDERPGTLRRLDTADGFIEIDDVDAQFADALDDEFKIIRSHLEDGVGGEIGRRLGEHAVERVDDALGG